MASLLDRFSDHLQRARLLAQPGTAIVAVSGGTDSVALLDLLQAVAAERGLALVVAHADHGIQEASGDVGKWVGGLAARYGLPFELGELNLGPNATETVARRARYAWLREVQRRRAARYLVTAHQQDDQVETVMLRVLRGSAPAGLAGIPARARGGLVRPLLPFTRAQLAAHVAAQGLAVHEDPANRDPRHLRSWIRLELLPLIERRLGAASRADLLRLARAAAQERRAWGRLLELVPELGLRRESHGFAVARASLARYDSALSVALLRAAARRVGLVLGPARARRLVRLASGASGRRVPLGGEWIAEVAFAELRVYRGVACAAEQVVATSEHGGAVFGAFRVAWRPEAAPERVERAVGRGVFGEEANGGPVGGAGRGDTGGFPGGGVVGVGLAKGRFLFPRGLGRRNGRPLQGDFLVAASYGNDTISSGSVRLLYDPETELRGKHILLVEDIVDTGKTLNRLVTLMRERDPKSLEICALLHKHVAEHLVLEPRFVGFDAPRSFLVGYGLDHAENFRHLPYIASLS